MMKKFMNDPNSFVIESLTGMLAAYPGFLCAHPENVKAIFRPQYENKKKVAIITGGGYGHLPAFVGYVGEGLCDGAAIGSVFSSPSATTIEQVARSVPNENGILFLIGNYMGDVMNVELAVEKLTADGIQSAIVTVTDDAASAPREEWKNRRGIGGIALIYKIAGSAAKLGKTLSEIVNITERAKQHLASYGAAFTSCQLPSTHAPVFEIGSDEMELGIGIHGESGVQRVKIMSSKDIASLMVDKLVCDLSLKKGDQVAVLLNGLGAASKEELFLFYHDVHSLLTMYGVNLVRSFVGEYATSLEMHGASLSLMKLDKELLLYFDEPAFSPFVHFYGPGKTH